MVHLLRRLAPSVLLVAMGSAITVGIFAWEPWESSGEVDAPSPQPTPDRPALSSQEAVGLVVGEYKECTRTAGVIAQNARAVYDGKGKWTVTYATEIRDYRWTVDETTRTVIPLGIPIRCA